MMQLSSINQLLIGVKKKRFLTWSIFCQKSLKLSFRSAVMPTLRPFFNVAAPIRRSYWCSDRIRRTFIDYYEKLGCTFVPSSSVLNKPGSGSLQFVNAGMNQFQAIFLGSSDLPKLQSGLKMAVNSQKCLRVNGKHCDLQNVGIDSTHHTFFEMLGNWAFNGHLSKFEACQQAWTLLTEVYGLQLDDFYATFFGGDDRLALPADLEARDSWLRLGFRSDQLIAAPIGDNFWRMGATGPCGPCTELLYGRSSDVEPKNCLELWNIVFIQYNQTKMDSLEPLPSIHIDTGMGLERLCRVLQGVDSNYDTDLFMPIIDKIRLSSVKQRNFGRAVECLVADHARACTVLLADGVRPAGKEVGHVLRRLLRSAAQKSQAFLGCKPGLLASLVPIVADTLHCAYPEVRTDLNQIAKIMLDEEMNFLDALRRITAKCKDILREKDGKLDSVDIFRLYETYGLPKQLIKDMVFDLGVQFHEEDFENQRLKHKMKSTPKNKFYPVG